MARKKGPPAGEQSRDDNKNFNDRRFKSGVEGVKAKEERSIKNWMDKNKA